MKYGNTLVRECKKWGLVLHPPEQQPLNNVDFRIFENLNLLGNEVVYLLVNVSIFWCPINNSKSNHKRKYGRAKFMFVKYKRYLIGAVLTVALGALIFYIAKVSSKNQERIEAKKDTTTSSAQSDEGDSVSVNQIVESGSLFEIIDKLMELESEDPKKRSAAYTQLHKERADLARRVLELDVTESQRVYATLTLLHALSKSDWQNSEFKLGFKHTRSQMIEFAENHLNDPNETVVARANFALAAIPAFDILKTPSLAKLEEVETEFQNRADKILDDLSSASHYADMVLAIRDQESEKLGDIDVESGEFKLFVDNVLATYEQHPSQSSKTVSEVFREGLRIREFELLTLIERIEENPDSSRTDVQLFFESLSEYPFGERSFKKAIASIAAYSNAGKKEDATQLADWLADIATRIKDIPVRDNVLLEIERVRELISNSTTANESNASGSN